MSDVDASPETPLRGSSVPWWCLATSVVLLLLAAIGAPSVACGGGSEVFASQATVDRWEHVLWASVFASIAAFVTALLLLIVHENEPGSRTRLRITLGMFVPIPLVILAAALIGAGMDCSGY